MISLLQKGYAPFSHFGPLLGGFFLSAIRVGAGRLPFIKMANSPATLRIDTDAVDEMRTSWKVALACGITTLALLVHGLLLQGKPKTEAITPQAAMVNPITQAIEPMQQATPNDAQAFAPPPKAAKPIEADPACTDDCFEQETGYNWAEQSRVDDPVDCESDSPSFVEGCQVYAETQQAAVDDSWEDK